MLEWTAVFIAICSGLAALIQGLFAHAFTRYLVTSPADALPPDQCPEAAILLPLRGADSRLEDTLRRLLRQDHPNFTVRVIIDNAADPAMAVALRVADEPGGERLRIATIQQRRTTCGLQCSALFEAAVQLEDSVVDVATIDGDVLVHSTWLRELVSPLQDPTVGASFGNRWFTPHHGQWGSIVRYLWNAAAIVPMWIFSIPWGGTLAIKRKWLVETGLMDQWKRIMVHDAPVPYLLMREGLDVKFVPSLMMQIGEACDLGFCFQFLKRQMLWTRMYHPNFTLVMLHAIFTAALAIAVGLAVGWSLIVGRWVAAGWLIGACIAYLGTMIFLLAMIDRAVMKVIQRRDDELIEYPTLGWLRLLIAIPVTQVVYTAAILAARMARTVQWRGITYEIKTPYDVKLVEDNLNSANASGRKVSL